MHALHLASLLLVAWLVLVSLLTGEHRSRSYRPGPMPPAQPRPGAPLAAALLFEGCLDLDQATIEDLEALPGIGAGRARRIHGYRVLHGPFATVDDLAAVPGIGRRTVEALRPYVSCAK
jgi:competence ComEA-like helix-hairpin-helix protein